VTVKTTVTVAMTVVVVVTVTVAVTVAVAVKVTVTVTVAANGTSPRPAFVTPRGPLWKRPWGIDEEQETDPGHDEEPPDRLHPSTIEPLGDRLGVMPVCMVHVGLLQPSHPVLWGLLRELLQILNCSLAWVIRMWRYGVRCSSNVGFFLSNLWSLATPWSNSFRTLGFLVENEDVYRKMRQNLADFPECCDPIK